MSRSSVARCTPRAISATPPITEKRTPWSASRARSSLSRTFSRFPRLLGELLHRLEPADSLRRRLGAGLSQEVAIDVAREQLAEHIEAGALHETDFSTRAG